MSKEPIPKIWTDRDIQAHLEDCDRVVDIRSFSDPEARPICCCGEAPRHTPMAVARAELDNLTTEVDL